MGAKKRLVYESEYLKVVKRNSNGKREPAAVLITLPPMLGSRTEDSRRLTITLDELFDLTEVLDDLCDEIDDETDLRMTTGRKTR